MSEVNGYVIQFEGVEVLGFWILGNNSSELGIGEGI